MPDLPTNVQFCGIKGVFALTRLAATDADGKPDMIYISGLQITLTPVPDFVTNLTATPAMTFVPESTVLVTDANGVLRGPDGRSPTYIVASDDADLNPTNWNYRVSFSGTQAAKFKEFTMTAPAGQIIDIAYLMANALNPTPGISTSAAVAAASSAAASATAAQQAAAQAGATSPVTKVAGRTGDVTLTKADVNLENVNNTSDADKPVSAATATAIATAKALPSKTVSTATYTLVNTDVDVELRFQVPCVVTVPADLSTVDGASFALTMEGVGTLEVSAGLNVKLLSAETATARRQYSSVTLARRGTTNAYLVMGDTADARRPVLTSAQQAVVSTAASSTNITHVVPAGNNRLMLVAVKTNNGGGGAVNNVTATYNGATLNAVASAPNPVVNTDSTGFYQRRIDLFYMIAPPVGTANLVININTSTTFQVDVLEFADVNQTTPLGSVATYTSLDSSSGTVTPEFAWGDVVACFIKTRNTATPGVGTDTQFLHGGAGYGAALKQGNSDTTITVTQNNDNTADRMSIAAVPVKAA